MHRDSGCNRLAFVSRYGCISPGGCIGPSEALMHRTKACAQMSVSCRLQNKPKHRHRNPHVAHGFMSACCDCMHACRHVCICMNACKHACLPDRPLHIRISIPNPSLHPYVSPTAASHKPHTRYVLCMQLCMHVATVCTYTHRMPTTIAVGMHTST